MPTCASLRRTRSVASREAEGAIEAGPDSDCWTPEMMEADLSDDDPEASFEEELERARELRLRVPCSVLALGWCMSA